MPLHTRVIITQHGKFYEGRENNRKLRLRVRGNSLLVRLLRREGSARSWKFARDPCDITMASDAHGDEASTAGQGAAPRVLTPMARPGPIRVKHTRNVSIQCVQWMR